MLFVYKLTKFFVKLFVKVVLLPVKLLARLAGNDAAVGMASGFADSLTSDDGATGNSSTASRTSQSTTRTPGTTRATGVVDTLSRVWGLLSQRPELLVPGLALGVARAVLVGPSSTPTEPDPTVFLGSLLVMVGGLWVSGVLAHAVADQFRGRERGVGALAEAAIPGMPYAVGVGLLVVLGASVLGGVFAVLAVATGPIVVLAVLPVLYLLVRVSLAVPAVFLSTRGVTGALRESWRRSSGNVLTLAGVLLISGLAATLTLLGSLGTIAATTLGAPLWMASVTYVYVGAGGAVEPGGGTTTTTGGGGSSAGSGGSEGGGTVPWNRSDADASGQAADSGAGRSTSTSGESRRTDGTTASTGASDAVVDDGALTNATGAALAETGPGESPGEPASGETATDETAVADETTAAPEPAASTPATAAEPETTAEDTVDESAAATATDDSPSEAGGAVDADDGAVEQADDGADVSGTVSLPEDDAERVALVAAAVESGDASPDHLDALVDALDADDPSVRRDAAEALGDLAVAEPSVADDAVAALRDCRLDPEVEVSEAASAALDRAREET